MKKIFKALAVCAVAGTLCAGVAAFAGCGDTAKTVDGEYKYENPYSAGSYYGVKVHVTVENNKVTKITFDADTDNMHNVTPSWGAHDVTVAAVDSYIAKFIGKTVDEVKAMNVETDEKGVPKSADIVFDTLTFKDKDGNDVTTGATQTAGRFILAIQDALKNL